MPRHRWNAVGLLLLVSAVACGGTVKDGPTSGGTPATGPSGGAEPALAGGAGTSGGPSNHPAGGSAGIGEQGGRAGDAPMSGGNGGATTCEYLGQTYRLNQEWPCGCTTCLCTSNGVAQYAVGCPTESCTYNGQSHTAGDTFPSRDGCGECFCRFGKALCSSKADCSCDPEQEWWRSYVSKSADGCMTIDYTCPDFTQPFSNECGCGCEESDACGEFVQCVTDDLGSCDTSSCPYAKVPK